jgi:hypothetical protein
VSYAPPFIKYSGYHYGDENAKMDCGTVVHAKVFRAEIVKQRHSDGRDWNGALAGALCNALLERHNGGYDGFDRGDYAIRPYCWCEMDDCAWCCGAAFYFMDYDTGLGFRWYKHPMRGFSANREYKASDILDMAKRFGVELADE